MMILESLDSNLKELERAITALDRIEGPAVFINHWVGQKHAEGETGKTPCFYTLNDEPEHGGWVGFHYTISKRVL